MNGSRFDRVIPAWVLVLTALLLWGGEYLRRDLWDPDEARYALISRECREDGHFFILHRQGEYYTHKPPLFFWLANAAVGAGASERVAARTPSLLGALMALFAITRLAAQWHGPAASWWVALLLPTSFLFWNKGGFGQIDMLLCGLELMGLYLLFTRDGAQPRRVFAAYALFGLAILAKGPVGLLVPLLVYGASSWAAGERERLRGWHWAWGPLVALLFPALWLLAAWKAGAPPEFFHELIFKQNVGRAAGAYDHLQPWYYFLQYFPLDFLPWTALLPLAWRALGRDAETRRERARLAAWILCVVAFFTLSKSKRNLYILLAYPAAALLVAASLRAWAAAPPAWLARTRLALALLLSLPAAGLLAAPFVPRADLPMWAAWPPAIAFSAGVWWTARSERPFGPAVLARIALSVFAGFALTGALVLPEFNDEKTPAEFVPVAASILQPGEYITFYKMQGEIVSLYTHRPGRMADDEDELRALLAAQPRNLIVAGENRRAELEALVGAEHPSGRFTSGSKTRIWIAPSATAVK